MCAYGKTTKWRRREGCRLEAKERALRRNQIYPYLNFWTWGLQNYEKKKILLFTKKKKKKKTINV